MRLLLLLLLALTPPSHRVPVLLELFTSEGCSSCPPADQLLERLDRSQPYEGVDVVVLSEHVDYWNSLGWRDPYSSALFTDRQRAYADRIDPASGTYTPELVIDGRAAVVGSDEGAVTSAITRAAQKATTSIAVSARRNGDTLEATVAANPLAETTKLYVALADDHAQSVVTRGENAGRTLTHVAVVRALNAFDTIPARTALDRTASFSLARERGGRTLRIVAWLQDTASGDVRAIGSLTVSGSP